MKKAFHFLLFVALLVQGCDGQPDIVQPGPQVLMVYPNPCYDNAFARVNNSSDVTYTLRVFDTEGNKIMEEPAPALDLSEFTVPLSGKSEGVYHILLETDASTIEFELLKLNR